MYYPENSSVVLDLKSRESCFTPAHLNMAQPKLVAEATLDKVEIMARAFDESEGGEGGMSPCPTFGDVSYGGYETTGVRSSNEGTTWQFSTTIDGAFTLLTFDSETAANNKALELGITVTISNSPWVEYNCDGTNDNTCWVCNRYPLHGPNGDPN